MKFSIRSLLLWVPILAILIGMFTKFFVLPALSDRPFAAVDLDGGRVIRLWAKPNLYSRVGLELDSAGHAKTVSRPPEKGLSLFVEVRSKEGEVIFPRAEMKVDLEAPGDFVTAVYSDDRKYAAIYAPQSRDILIIADFENEQFASPMTIWADDYQAIQTGPPRGFSDISPGPVRRRWNKILNKVKQANPTENIDWNCL